MRRVLLVTSHPIGPPADSADKAIALSVMRTMPDYRHVAFCRLGEARPPAPGAWIPVWSHDGRPGLVETAQVGALGAVAEMTVQLVHVVMTIGPGYRSFARLRRILPLRRPLLHTVPGVATDDALVAGPIGLTVALTTETADRLRHAGFDDVRVVPPGLDLGEWPLLPAPQGPPTILFAGHADVGGGAHEALEGVAAAFPRSDGPRIVLLMAMRTRTNQDEVTELDRIRQRSRDLDVASEVHGVVPSMAGLMVRSHIVVFPARRLAGKADIPLTLLEAMASGRPVIVSDLPAFRRFGDAVTRVPPGDATRLGEAVVGLLSDASRWERYRDAGRRFVAEHHSLASVARAYRELYGELAMRVS